MTVDKAARHGEVVIVADAESCYPRRDGHYAELDEERPTSSELLRRHLPGARVLKAFNALPWTVLAMEDRSAD
jgi:predicted dinucleotide-binding enzyme